MRSHDPVGIVQGSIISASVKIWVGVGRSPSSKQTSVDSSTAAQERAFDPSVLKSFQRLIKCHFNCPLNVIKSERWEQNLNYTQSRHFIARAKPIRDSSKTAAALSESDVSTVSKTDRFALVINRLRSNNFSNVARLTRPAASGHADRYRHENHCHRAQRAILDRPLTQSRREGFTRTHSAF